MRPPPPRSPGSAAAAAGGAKDLQPFAALLRLMDYPIGYFIPTYNWISVDTPSGSRGTVLVVDDDVQVRALTARALADDGFDVLQAPDAITAIGLLEDPLGAPVGLVITDIVMPGMRGDEFGRLLHSLRPMLPVLYMSGYSRPDLDFLPPSDLEHCWLQKPFSLPALVERARALCVPARTLS